MSVKQRGKVKLILQKLFKIYKNRTQEYLKKAKLEELSWMAKPHVMIITEMNNIWQALKRTIRLKNTLQIPPKQITI